MKATFEIPDELYREVKATTAREGRTLRDVAISLFEQWLRERKQAESEMPTVDWRNFQTPLAHLVPDGVTAHSVEAMRASVTKNWNEPK